MAFDGVDFILRVRFDDGRQNPDKVRGELDFMRRLAGAGVPVTKPLPALHGSELGIHEANGADAFFACGFSKAPGGEPPRANRGPGVYRDYGRLLGAMD